MRIVQISDFHLNKDNIGDLRDYYIDAFVADLKSFHDQSPIDVILITGDLVDKGGSSLGDTPYKTFEENLIQPITNKLAISSNKILMIPGNHDINRELIEETSEFFLSQKLTSDLANIRAENFHTTFNNENRRIQQFKEFEKSFHKDTPSYRFSNNESLVIIKVNEQKIGFALINDSWRCSAELRREQHFIGYKQLFRARNYFNDSNTDMNIAVFHHPLNAINENERDEIRNILKTKNFDIAIFGHSHRHEADRLLSSSGGFLSVNGRSAFSDPTQLSSIYQPGYSILDVDPITRAYKITARKFIRQSGFRFDKDTDSLPNGEETGMLFQNDRLYQLADDSNNEDKDLPNSYTADVDRIVSLLIGESIYPDRYAFVRELIQNSVDACNRIREKHTHLNPKITINIDTAGNYFEVIDEGDGMTKHVIKNHFAVIGKSISQEYNDNAGKVNLISKFGIGFISTFIVAEKVVINTKSEEDDQIIFEIENVFKGFKYLQPSIKETRSTTGTTIRVYLKKGYDTNMTYQHIWQYCRHIENLEINYNSSVVRIEDRWNLEGALYSYSDKSSWYELKLGLNNNPKGIIASYCGFLISTFPSPILPYRFPAHIGGEVNFFPKGIDFDVSRTNIIPSEKSQSFRRDMSSAVRILFRDAMEKNNPNVHAFITNYLHYYLQHFDANQANMEASYKDFYSKKELISLCSEHTIVDYGKVKHKLSHVIAVLKAKSLDRIYVLNSAAITDYQAIVIQYLESKGNLIIRNRNQTVNFQDAQPQTVSLTTVVQLIAGEHNISIQDIAAVPSTMLSDMKLDKTQFHPKIQLHLSNIERDYSVTIEIGIFSEFIKPSVSNGNQIFLNHSHSTFQSLLQNVETLSDDIFHIYLLGLLGLKLQD